VPPAPIFIVGCPRSGTGLVRNLLRSHPNLSFPRESHFIVPFYRAYGDPRTEREAIDLATRILATYWIRRWRLDVGPERFGGFRSFREVTSLLFELYAQREGKPRWGDKTPHYVTGIATLVELFPDARVIHIVRDGRDVALSWLDTQLEPGNLYTAAVEWRARVTAGRLAGSRLPRQNYLEVQYETVLSDLPAAMRTICEFVGEPYTDAVLIPNPPPVEPDVKFYGVSLTEVVPGNIGKWKARMTTGDRWLFESIAGDLLGELGYEVEGRVRQISWLERGFWKAHHTIVRLIRRRTAATNPGLLRTTWEFGVAGLRRRFR
jgi:hypothetical protein